VTTSSPPSAGHAGHRGQSAQSIDEFFGEDPQPGGQWPPRRPMTLVRYRVATVEEVKNRGAVISGLARALMLVCVLAGVLAMHALTMNHDPRMATLTTVASPAAGVIPGDIESTAHSGHTSRSPTDAGMSAAAVTVGMAKPAPGSQWFSKLAVLKYQSAGGHQMAAMCLAILSTSLLLVGLALMLGWLRSARFAPWAQQVRPVHLSPLLERSPPWLAPSLSKLCVLRT